MEETFEIKKIDITSILKVGITGAIVFGLFYSAYIFICKIVLEQSWEFKISIFFVDWLILGILSFCIYNFVAKRINGIRVNIPIKIVRAVDDSPLDMYAYINEEE